MLSPTSMKATVVCLGMPVPFCQSCTLLLTSEDSAQGTPLCSLLRANIFNHPINVDRAPTLCQTPI